VERADDGQLLAAWVTAEARVRPPVVGGAPFVLVGDSVSPAGALSEEPNLPHPAPCSSVAPAVSDGVPGGTAGLRPRISGVPDLVQRSAVSAGQVLQDMDGEVDVATALELEKELLGLVSDRNLPVIVSDRSTISSTRKGFTPSGQILHAIDANVERHQAARPTPPSGVRSRRWHRATAEHIALGGVDAVTGLARPR
jgi:hypothetical protein